MSIVGIDLEAVPVIAAWRAGKATFPYISSECLY